MTLQTVGVSYRRNESKDALGRILPAFALMRFGDYERLTPKAQDDFLVRIELRAYVISFTRIAFV